MCLPDAYNSYVGQRCHSTGWGKDAFGNGGKYQTILKEVELPIVSHRQCERALQRTRLGPNFSLHIGNLCAGGEGGKDACKVRRCDALSVAAYLLFRVHLSYSFAILSS